MKSWIPFTINELKEIFQECPARWWLAGGYALDCYLGKTTREHEDMDIIVLRDDQLVIQEYLHNFDLFIAHKTLRKWYKGDIVDSPIQDIWVREKSTNSFKLQIMMVDNDEEKILFKHKSSITFSLLDFGFSKCDMQIIKPEIQLLYKFWNKEYREKDILDLIFVLPKLARVEIDWLCTHLQMRDNCEDSLG